MARILAILVLAALAQPASSGPVYKCTGADGKTYYSEQPCPKSASSEVLRVQKAPAGDEESADDADAGKTLDERIAEATDPIVKARLELRKQECELARTALERYEGAPYLVERQADGSERRLSDEEAEAEKQQLRDKIRTECR